MWFLDLKLGDALASCPPRRRSSIKMSSNKPVKEKRVRCYSLFGLQILDITKGLRFTSGGTASWKDWRLGCAGCWRNRGSTAVELLGTLCNTSGFSCRWSWFGGSSRRRATGILFPGRTTTPEFDALAPLWLSAAHISKGARVSGAPDRFPGGR